MFKNKNVSLQSSISALKHFVVMYRTFETGSTNYNLIVNSASVYD